MDAQRTSRRRYLAGLAGLTAGGLAVAGTTGAASERPAAAQSGATVALETVAEGFTSPLAVAVPPGADRPVVADQVGLVSRVGPDGPEPFLNLQDRTVDVSGYSEMGLLGLAFHPEYAENGRFYVRYSAPGDGSLPGGYSHRFVLSEFRASADRTRARPDSERELLSIAQPQSNHNAGAVAFGPDGSLYVGVGDGGGANDRGTGHVADWYDAVEGGNGQDVTENLLGSVLRIDVDGCDGDRPYAIPADNPLVGRSGLDEQFAWGFRNPWRFSFDGDRLFVADVGQSRYEEVDLVEAGGNYGWNVREGAHCFAADSCPTESPRGRPLRDPIVEYPHSDATVSGVAVIGGYVYRGDAIPALDGAYVFGDWRGGATGTGTLYAARPPENGDGAWTAAPIPVAGTETGGIGGLGGYLLSFGRAADGELYVCTTQRGGVAGETGQLHRLVPADESDGTTGDGGDDGFGTRTEPSGGTPGLGLAAAVGGLAGGVALRRLLGGESD